MNDTPPTGLAEPPPGAVTAREATGTLRLSEVVAAMTYALDLTEGQPEGHALRGCLIGMAVGTELGLESAALSNLFYALLLKDLGCSSNSAKIHYLFGADDFRVKRAFKTVNLDRLSEGAPFVLANAGSAAPLSRRLRHVLDVSLGRHGGHTALTRVRCERGADIARQMGFSEPTAAAIRALDEHWDGNGHPYRLAGEAIPLLGRILCLAQTAEVFFGQGGPDGARRAVTARSGSWFDPATVAAFGRVQERAGFWEGLAGPDLEARVRALEPAHHIVPTDDRRLDRVAEAFARVIDAKSPWTYRHSERVRRFALGAAAQVVGAAAFSEGQLNRLSRAALLHDIGKLGVPNTILDKQGRLTEAEFAAIKRHPAYGERILGRVGPFRELSKLAGAHHERLDGRGYYRAVPGAELAFEVRLLSVADQFEALTAARPYREGLSPDAALGLLHQDAGSGVDPEALAALESFLVTPEATPLLAPVAPDPEIPLVG